MKETLERTVTLKIMECGTCSVTHAIPQTLYDALQNDGGYWHCPLGHMRGWAEGQKARDEKDLRRQLDAATRRAERAESNQRQAELEREWAQNSLRSTQGVVTKLKKRAAGGVCPCCNRHFTALERHMAVKHPEFSKEGA